MKSLDTPIKKVLLPIGNKKLLLSSTIMRIELLYFWLWELWSFLTNFDKLKIVDRLMIIFGASIQAAFVGTKYTFSRSGSGHSEAGHKWHDLAEEKPQRKNLNLISLIKGWAKRIKESRTSTMFIKQCLTTFEYLTLTFWTSVIKVLPSNKRPRKLWAVMC